MESLIDSLNTEKWTEISAAERGDGFVEYSINRNAKQVDDTTLALMIADDAGNAKTVTLSYTLPKKNPVKSVSRSEIKLDAEGKTVLGIDLDGDCVVMKS